MVTTIMLKTTIIYKKCYNENKKGYLYDNPPIYKVLAMTHPVSGGASHPHPHPPTNPAADRSKATAHKPEEHVPGGALEAAFRKLLGPTATPQQIAQAINNQIKAILTQMKDDEKHAIDALKEMKRKQEEGQ